MDKQYKEWLQDQTFETLATDNYNVKLLLLAEQAKNKKLVELVKSLKYMSSGYWSQSESQALAKGITNKIDEALKEVNNAK